MLPIDSSDSIIVRHGDDRSKCAPKRDLYALHSSCSNKPANPLTKRVKPSLIKEKPEFNQPCLEIREMAGFLCLACEKNGGSVNDFRLPYLVSCVRFR